MVKRSGEPRRYRVWLEAELYQERDKLPGNVRQRPPYNYEDLEKIVTKIVR